MPRYLFQHKAKILANKEIREFYEPSAEHTRELRPNEKGWPTAWLSPYSSAVRASIRKAKTTKGQKLDARKQIKELSEWIRVSKLPDFVRIAGDQSQHFFVELSYMGRSKSSVARLGEYIETQLQAHSVREIATKSQSSIGFSVHMEEPQSILTEKTITDDFYDEHPASWKSYPLALDERGNTWSLPLTHTLIFGMTGSGKGSPFNGVIRQSIPFVNGGTAKLYGIDPKESEILPWEFSSLFERTVYSADDSMELISELYEMLLKRNASKRAGMIFEEGKADLKRRIPASKEYPVILILIDELLTLILELRQKGAAGKAVEAKLAQIMALGRSAGMYLIAATQIIEKEILGRMRDNFVYCVTLRNQASDTMNEVFLGDGAIERGFDPRSIAESTEANNYATSGMGYVKGPQGDPVLVRFAYMSDEAIAAMVRKYPKGGKADNGLDTLANDFSDDDDGGFAITSEDDGKDDSGLEVFSFEEELPRAD